MKILTKSKQPPACQVALTNLLRRTKYMRNTITYKQLSGLVIYHAGELQVKNPVETNVI